MRLLGVAVIVSLSAGCNRPSPPGPPVRLAIADSDTVIVTGHWPKRLPVHALDVRGRAVPAPIRFELATRTGIATTSAGTVTCNGSGDLAIRATLDDLTTEVVVLCRLVESVRIPGPIQFVLGDSALSQPRPIPVGVYDHEGRAVTPYPATIQLPDDIATLRGDTLYPRVRGKTLVGVHVGDVTGWTGVHVYQRVESLAGLDTLLRIDPRDGRLFAVPVRLEAGASQRHPLPQGSWMLATLASKDQGDTPIRVTVEHAACAGNVFNEPGRLSCRAGANASVVVFRPMSDGGAPIAEGYLLVAENGQPDRRRFLPRVAATDGGLECVERYLREQGYDRSPTDDQRAVKAERRDDRLGSPWRRELIEVRLVPGPTGATLRGRAWAVDSFPTAEGRPGRDPRVVVEPLEETLFDGRAALNHCGRA